MEPTNDAESILLRLKIGTGAKSDSMLANFLGVTQQAVSNARKNNKVPDSWLRTAAERYHLSADWLFFGRGEIIPGIHSGHPGVLAEPAAEADPCSDCDRLRAELEEEKRERRSLYEAFLKKDEQLHNKDMQLQELYRKYTDLLEGRLG